MKFKNGYFRYNDDDTIFPLHRIVAIYNWRGEYLLKRRFNSEYNIIIKPSNIKLYPGIEIYAIYSEFQIARYAWIIYRQLEGLLDKNLDDVLTMLGNKFYDKDKLLIVTSNNYFYGTVIDRRKMRIYRGNRPITWNNIKDNINYQRIYQYGTKLNKIVHYLQKCRVEIAYTGDIKITTEKNGNRQYSILLTTHNEILGTIDQKTKMLMHPNYSKINKHKYAPIRAITTKEWIYTKGIAIITDYDSLLTEI